MTGSIRTLIAAGVVAVGGLQLGTERAEAQAFGPGTSFNLNLGISKGYAPRPGYGPGIGHGPGVGYGRGPGFGRGHGHGYGPPACAPGGFRHGPGHGHGHGRVPSYYSETTVITTVVTCDRCGRKHDRHHRCGGPHHGGYDRPHCPPRRHPW